MNATAFEVEVTGTGKIAEPANLGESCNCGGTVQCNGSCSADPCPTYNQIAFDVKTGSDDLRSDSSATPFATTSSSSGQYLSIPLIRPSHAIWTMSMC